MANKNIGKNYGLNKNRYGLQECLDRIKSLGHPAEEDLISILGISRSEYESIMSQKWIGVKTYVQSGRRMVELEEGGNKKHLILPVRAYESLGLIDLGQLPEEFFELAYPQKARESSQNTIDARLSDQQLSATTDFVRPTSLAEFRRKRMENFIRGSNTNLAEFRRKRMENNINRIINMGDNKIHL